MLIDPILLSYLAGIVDGEGSLGYQGHGIGRPKRLVLEVKMTDKSTIDLLHQTFGGAVDFRPRQKEHWKDQWRWRVTSKKAQNTVNLLLPYLRIKRVNAEV